MILFLLLVEKLTLSMVADDSIWLKEVDYRCFSIIGTRNKHIVFTYKKTEVDRLGPSNLSLNRTIISVSM